VAAGDNRNRLRKEPSFAALCGGSPLDASSGQQQRHRLNRAATARRTVPCSGLCSGGSVGTTRRRRPWPGESQRVRRRGKTIRCLKRYVVTEVYAAGSHISDISSLIPCRLRGSFITFVRFVRSFVGCRHNSGDQVKSLDEISVSHLEQGDSCRREVGYPRIGKRRSPASRSSVICIVVVSSR
jgi:hypothetical protein